MNKKLLKTALFALLFPAISATAALPYDMTFVGRGETTTVETVMVENITRGSSLTLSGTDVLRLTDTPTSIDESVLFEQQTVLVHPNPSRGEAMLTFLVPQSGKVGISLVNLAGQMVLTNQFTLEAGKHSAVLPAMPGGIYMVSLYYADGTTKSLKWYSIGDAMIGFPVTIRLHENTGAELPLVKAGKTSSSPAKSKGVTRLVIDEKQALQEPIDGKLLIKPLSREIDENATVIEMYFEEGDLLRFTGSSGNRKCIVMNAPTLSHNITFDFYTCTDASGNHYAIVNAGGLLWMAEDLRMVRQGMSLVSNAADWTDTYSAEDPKVAYYNYDNANSNQGAFFNYAAAVAALPAGWKLPTQGEIDYMINSLGGYTDAVAKLKSRTDGAWNVQPAGLDSISFSGVAAGQLNTKGTFQGKGSLMRYWTRSLKNGKPNYWGLQSTTLQNAANKQVIDAPAFTGLRVRGCRMAPSPYNEVIDLFTKSNKMEAKANASATFDNGPLGGNYTVAMGKHKLFVDLNSSEKTSDINFYRYNYNGTTTETPVPMTSYSHHHLKKATAQSNASGYQNLVVAYWNNKFTDGIYGTKATTSLIGAGTVSLVIYADSLGNYARLDSITLSVDFEMPSVSDPISIPYTKTKDLFHRHNFIIQEQYSKHFNVAAADFNGDGIDEIVVVVGKKVVVFDGLTYRKISEKTFTSNNVRIAVGDVDNDHTPDLAALYPLNTESAQVEVYPGGDLTARVIANATMPVGELNDIKIGNVAGNGQNQIVCFTRPSFANAPTKPVLRVFDYDTGIGGSLKQIANYSDFNNSWALHNNNVVLVHFRGSALPADIVAYNTVFRYNSGNGALTILDSGLPENSLDNAVFSDNMIAGNFDYDEEGKEELMYIIMEYDYYHFNVVDCYTGSGGSIKHLQLDNNGTFSLKTFHNKLKPTTGFYYYLAYSTGYGYKNYAERISYPLLAAVRSATPAQVLRYREHKTTLSEPRIYALLAAPPYYKYQKDGVTPYEYSNYGSMGTSWGKSQVTGTGKANASSNSVSAIFGYEQEFTLPIIGTKIGGIDFTSKLEFEWTNSTEKEVTTTQSIEFTTSQQDAVILTATFFDTYTYEIIKSGNPDDVGSLLNISLPSTTRTMGLTLEDYERLTADNPAVPNLRKLFKHKEGFPFTYPGDKSEITSNVTGGEILWAMPFGGDEFVYIGSGTDVDRGIVLDETTTRTAGFNFDLEMELVASVGGVKAGAGYGHGDSNESSHTEGEGHSIAGNVLGVNNTDDVPNFRWTVCWYKYNIGGQTFPVVYYVVKE